jgi:hypothetical protein
MTPAVRRIIRENQLNAAIIPATGKVSLCAHSLLSLFVPKFMVSFDSGDALDEGGRVEIFRATGSPTIATEPTFVAETHSCRY